MKVVKKVLNTRSEEELNELRQAMMAEQKEPTARYVNATPLLYEDPLTGARTAFLELLKTQHVEDCVSMERSVVSCIDQVCEASAAAAAATAASSVATLPSTGGGTMPTTTAAGLASATPVAATVQELPVSKLREALMLSDANKSRMEINQLLARGAGCSLEEVLLKEAKRVVLSVEAFKSKVVAGLLKKSPIGAPKKAKK